MLYYRINIKCIIKLWGNTMIVFDLEWTQPFGQDSMEEIIQIGAVKIDELGGPITDSFTVYTRPSVYQELSPIVKRLPDVAFSMNSEIVFPDAYQAFVDWCADDTVFASWGGQDIGVLAKNAKHWELPTFTAVEFYNLQAAFCRTLDADRQISLETAVSYCQIPAVFPFHNALYDAMYAAMVTGWIDPAALPTPPKHKKPQKRKAFFSILEYPAQPRYKVGIFPTREKVMNGRKARFAHCPICQERFCVCRWYPLDEQVFYSTIVCPEHGRFPVRLTVTHRTDGQWHGRSTIPVLRISNVSCFSKRRPMSLFCVGEVSPNILGGETAGRMTPATISSEIPLLCAQKDVDRWSASFLP